MNQQPTTLFTPYKALGHVCSAVPPTFQSLPKEKRVGDVNAAIGNVFVTYRMQPFRRYKVSDPLPDTITVLEKDKAFVFAAYGSVIGVFRHNQTLVKQIDVEKDVKFMLSFIDILVVVDIENTIRIIDVNEGSQVLEIPSPPNFNATSIVHPLTYMNKIVLGGSNGEMRLINIKTGKLIHEFSPKPLYISSITSIVQSTVVDIVAIGHTNGRIQLRNLKTDEILCSFKQDGSITAISFRTDGIESMVTGNSEGSIAIWDLDNQMLLGQRPNAHKGSITALYFVKGSPYLISAGVDNRMIKWAVEEEQSLPTINTELAGHSAPVTALAFFGENSMVSASADGFVRGYNIIRDDIMKSLGKAREVKKSEVSRDRFMDVPLEPIVEMDVGNSREAAWDNVICRHEGSPIVSTWSTRRQTKGEKLLYHERFAKNPDYISASATSINLSSCGNMAFIGYSTGHVDMFNLQSGLLRGTFIMKDVDIKESTRPKDDFRAHSHSVNALASDLCSQKLFSGDSKGLVRFWTIKPTKCLVQCKCPGGVIKFKLDRFNSLLAVATDTGNIAIIDALSGKIARKFNNAHTDNTITALEYSRDGQWLVSADNKGKIKVWDVTTSILIDCMLCPSPCVSLAFNPGGQFLATAHEGERAVYVWANISMFIDDVDLKLADEDSTDTKSVQLPGLTAGGQPNIFDDDEDDDEEGIHQVIIDSDADNDEDKEDMDAQSDDESIDYRESEDLFSFSGLPPARWANLSELEAIKARNKPIEPPKKPKHAPFFLPTIESVEGVAFEKMDITDIAERDKTIAAKRKMLELETPFAAKLKACRQPPSYLNLFDEIKSMSLSSIDFEIRSLAPSTMIKFLNLLIAVFAHNRNLDLAQAYLITFLRIHRETLWNVSEDDDEKNMEELGDTLEAIKDLVQTASQTLKLDVNQNLAVLQWIKAAVVQIC